MLYQAPLPVKKNPRIDHKGTDEEQRYTLVLDGSGWSVPRPGRFTPGKETRYPFYRRLGGP